MKLREISALLSAKLLHGEDCQERAVHSAFASDMMSDALAMAKDKALLLTGLNNPQVVRTAEMMDMVCIVLVRGKEPAPEVIKLAQERNIALMTTPHRLFTACGLLYQAGLRDGSDESCKKA